MSMEQYNLVVEPHRHRGHSFCIKFSTTALDWKGREQRKDVKCVRFHTQQGAGGTKKGEG
jgi:hypothetical protein